jgi:hypothetical protein
MVPGELDDYRFGAKTLEFGRSSDAMVRIFAPSAARHSAEFGVRRSQAASQGAQVGVPLADVVEKGSPDQILPFGLSLRRVDGGLQAMTLVEGRLGEKHDPLGVGEPSGDGIDLGLCQGRREQHGNEPVSKMAPGPEGRILRRTQESFALQSTQ